MRFEPRQALAGLFIAGVMGAILFLPAISFLGNTLLPNEPEPPSRHAPPLLSAAIWARARGGQAAELQPINPFTLGIIASCHIRTELFADRTDRDKGHDDCMKLMPGIQAVGYLSNQHLRSHGIWQDARVPFAQIATMRNLSSKWTRTELVDALAERTEFPFGVYGAYDAAHIYFGKSADELSLPEAATLAAIMADRHVDPWCAPDTAVAMRRGVLEEMRENLVIDDAAFDAADRAELRLASPPAAHTPCAP